MLRLAGFGVVSAVLSCSLLVDTEDLDNAQCSILEKACDSECVSVSNPLTGCASPESCVPCLVQNATPRCTTRGQCDIASCLAGYEDCNARPADGCEVDLAHDPANCGKCGQQCESPQNAEPGCAAQICTIARCHAGYRDCNGSYDDGCEVNLLTNANHCGACRQPCDEGMRCVDGACTGAEAGLYPDGG